MSLRSSERGLKSYTYFLSEKSSLSLRSSERGLKSNARRYLYKDEQVAPFVGAWIEIVNNNKYTSKHFVAPFVGAWIEI